MVERLTKAALATGGAAILLLGGAGTLAYWTAEGTAEGPEIIAGSFSLSDSSCADTWLLDDGTPLTDGLAIVPGDTLTLECIYTIAGQGQHLALGDVSVTAPEWEVDNALTAELSLDEPSFTVNGAVPELPAPIVDGDTVEVALGVVFDGPGATNASQSTDGTELVAALDGVTVTLTQAHAETDG